MRPLGTLLPTLVALFDDELLEKCFVIEPLEKLPRFLPGEVALQKPLGQGVCHEEKHVARLTITVPCLYVVANLLVVIRVGGNERGVMVNFGRIIDRERANESVIPDLKQARITHRIGLPVHSSLLSASDETSPNRLLRHQALVVVGAKLQCE